MEFNEKEENLRILSKYVEDMLHPNITFNEKLLRKVMNEDMVEKPKEIKTEIGFVKER